MGQKGKARDPEVVSRIMARVRSKNTLPELQLRKALRSLNYRFGLHNVKLPGTPDVVFSERKLAVFVDGDFWHGRQWRTRGLKSLESQFARVRNRSYWIKKISGNIRRDARVSRQLRRMGWHVARIWESDLSAHPERCIRRVQLMLDGLR